MTSESSSDNAHGSVEESPPQKLTLKDYVGGLLEGQGTDDAVQLLSTTYREHDEFEDSDSDESDISVKAAPQEEEVIEDAKTKKFGHLVKGEITLDDLPPVEKLQITVPQDLLVYVGDLCSCVDCLVVVESTGDHPVLNLDTALFLEDGRAIGLVFDVIGPVKKPYYVLRFNNSQEIADEHLTKGTKIYFANGHEKTYFVFEKQIRELMQMKGSDASWEHDIEPPEHEIDYSNDEEERAAKQERRAKRHLNGQPIDRRPSNGDVKDGNNNNNQRNRRKGSRCDTLADDTASASGQYGPGAGPRRSSADYRSRQPPGRNMNHPNRNFHPSNAMMMGHHNNNMQPPHNVMMPYTQGFPAVPPDHNPWAQLGRPVAFPQIFPPMPQQMYGPGTNIMYSPYGVSPPMCPSPFLPNGQLAAPMYMSPPPTNPPPYARPYQQGPPGQPR